MARYIPTGVTEAGGIGTVSFCTDTNLDRKVAIKYLYDGGDHSRLLDELAALQRIRSKHVVRVLDVVYEKPDGGQQMGLVLEFISGKSVAELVGQVAADQSFVRLVYQMACGIADIHDVRVIHRDIKPLNMKVDDEQILKIIDFNLARDIKDGKTQGFKGTQGLCRARAVLRHRREVWTGGGRVRAGRHSLGVPARQLTARQTARSAAGSRDVEGQRRGVRRTQHRYRSRVDGTS